MSCTIQQIEQDALRLPQQERVELIHRLLDSVVKTNGEGLESYLSNGQTTQNGADEDWESPYESMIGMFASDKSGVAERAREILRDEVDKVSGLNTRR